MNSEGYGVSNSSGEGSLYRWRIGTYRVVIVHPAYRPLGLALLVPYWRYPLLTELPSGGVYAIRG